MNIPPILPQIDHIVMVMLENRSLDNLLGWLYNNNDGIKPARFIGKQPFNEYDGLKENTYSNWLNTESQGNRQYFVQKGTGSDGFIVPNLDPNEDFPNVISQIFGDENNQPTTPPATGIVPDMAGFLNNFDAWDDTWNETLQIMKTYAPSQLPIIHSLARMGAVSDRWYCSLPSQTNPNRAFSLCGTSLGRLSNLHLDAIEQFNAKTIWNALHDNGNDWALYFHETWQKNQCYTQYTFPYINQAMGPRDVIAQIGTRGSTPQASSGFYQRAMLGQLPAFTYIEPKWGYGVEYGVYPFHQGNDYHPPADVRPAETLLADLYLALSYNRTKWNRTLFIITFDEHGGTYDHHSPSWKATDPNVPGSIQSNFNWKLFGVRVPTILVSPCITSKTIFRSQTDIPYDHTSLIATILKWKGIDPVTAGMGDRVKVAPTFEGVLNSLPQNTEEIDASIPADYPSIDDVSELDKLTEGIPTAVARSIAQHSRSEEHLLWLIEKYRSAGELREEDYKKFEV